MNVTEALIAAKDKISNKKNWTRRAFARDIFGIVVDNDAKNATCWCSVGAILLVAGYDDYHTQMGARQFLRQAMVDIAQYNDNHTHDEVMQKWDEAIELSKQQTRNYYQEKTNDQD